MDPIKRARKQAEQQRCKAKLKQQEAEIREQRERDEAKRKAPRTTKRSCAARDDGVMLFEIAAAGWASAVDEASGNTYYYNTKTGTTSWVWPPE